MDKFFFWLSDNPPDPAIATDSWTNFLGMMATASLTLIGAICIATLFLYWNAAAHRRIQNSADVFAPYTPMYWMLLVLVVLFGVAGLSFWRYEDSLGSSAGLAVFAAEAGLWSTALAFAACYLLIVLTPITPPKYRYRPLWLIYRNKGVKA